MNIADLFINLGIKGTDKTVGALTGMQKGLKETSSMALETKVALVGAVYALERLFAASGQKGTDLTNFNSLLGVSAKTLQQYEYAARQVGVSNEEVDGTFKSLQATMTKTLMGEGAPKGLARVSQLTGGLSADDLKKFAEKPQELLQKLQEYAQKETNVGLKNEVLKSFGVSDSMIAALNRKAFRPEVLNKAPTYSDREVSQLDKANIAWSNLGNKVQMAIGHFNAQHGGELVTGISKMVDQVLRLAEAFVKLGEKLHAMDWFTQTIENWVKITGGLSDVIDAVGGDKKKQESIKQDLTDVGTGAFETFKDVIKEHMGNLGTPLEGDKLHEGLYPGQKSPAPSDNRPPVNPNVPTTAKAIRPNVAPIATKPTSQNINVNQNLNFSHDGKDAKKTGDSTKKAIKDAFRQIPAQAQGS